MAIAAKLNVGIIGSGKIGTDLLIKIMRSDVLHCGLFVGRDFSSKGLQKAKSLGVNVSDQSIAAFTDSNQKFDIVFDATSAAYHKQHAEVFRAAGIKAIDLTPAKVGRFCVPSIDGDIVNQEDNINMVTCGGQASIPIINALSTVYQNISLVEVHSHLAEDSVGPGTLANIDEYYSSTAAAISTYSSVQNVDVHLQVEKSSWKPDMLTVIRAHTSDSNLEKLYGPLHQRLLQVRTHVPGYHIIGTPRYLNGAIEILISIRGLGDWIPSHAGNLDIINCAAIAIAEKHAAFRGIVPERTKEQRSSLGSLFGVFGNANVAAESA
ncbi:acetaldehyde dehydrogenase [Alteromonadaceae bacterium 2753L.S.0a.02]|nr:acetaldehyde dehydrogenase [Alteromonadaceae bacterium 2753L.S.0a.02]